MTRYFLSVIALFCMSSGVFSAEVAKSDITYIAPWTPFVDVQMGATAIDPESCGNSNSYRIDLVDDSGSQNCQPYWQHLWPVSR